MAGLSWQMHVFICVGAPTSAFHLDLKPKLATFMEHTCNMTCGKDLQTNGRMVQTVNLPGMVHTAKLLIVKLAPEQFSSLHEPRA